MSAIAMSVLMFHAIATLAVLLAFATDTIRLGLDR